MQLMKSMLLVIAVCGAGITATAQDKPQTSTLSGKTKNTVVPEKVKAEYFTEFSREVPAEPGSVLKIKNSRYNLEIRLWDEKKVKIVSTVTTADDTTRLTNEQIYGLSGITLNAFGNRIDLESTRLPADPRGEVQEIRITGTQAGVTTDIDGVREVIIQGKPTRSTSPGKRTDSDVKEVVVGGKPGKKTTTDKTKAVEEVVVVGYESASEKNGDHIPATEIPISATNQPRSSSNSIYESNRGGVTEVVVTGYKSTWTRTSSTRKNMVIFIPRDCKLAVDNRSTDIVVNEDLGMADFTLYRSNLSIKNARDLKIDANFYTIYTGDVSRADFKLSSGSLTGGTIEEAEIESDGSEIDYEGGKKLFLKSQSDRIDVDEVGTILGYKQFGDLRIGQLTNEINLSGKSANIKIRRISPAVSCVRISTQFADLRLPVKQLTDYKVSFKGDNSTVYSGFEKKATNANAGIANSETLVAAGMTFGEKALPAFSIQVGNPAAKQTLFDITCDGCMVDFK